MIRRINLNGNPNIGVSISTTDNVAIVPMNMLDSAIEVIKEALEVEIIKTSISGSSLAGALSIGNSNGILVSRYALDREVEKIKKADVDVGRIPDRFTAVGNIILANDNGALVNPLLSDESVDVIETVLNVEVVKTTIAGFKIIGSVGTATNKGILLHPQTTKNELELVEKIMKVSADIGTVNNGVGLIGACTAANSNGVIVSQDTTGPELARIEESLGFLEGYL
ncbi:MAG: translation initiation factor IF-6 [Methanobacteriaceae archaeon]